MNLIKLSSAVNYIIFAISVFAAFVNFIVRSVAYFDFARLRRFRFVFLAFVPFLQYFILGRICDDINLKKGLQTSHSFWIVFFSFGFGLPSAISHIFPNLPLFTFECYNSRVYVLNCLLFLFNFFYIYFYIDCCRIVFRFYKIGFGWFFLIFSACFIVIGLDFFVSLILLSLVNRQHIYSS